MTREEFEELVGEALDRIPPELTAADGQRRGLRRGRAGPADDPELLGLYEGTPLTDRGEWYAGRAARPDHRLPGPHAADVRRPASEVVAEMEVTVVHEIAHHFGIDDERLHALGYG